MKKLLAILLALMLVLVNVAALAAGEGDNEVETGGVDTSTWTTGKTDPWVVPIKKNYTLTGGTTFPAESIAFTSAAATDNPDGGAANLTVANYTVVAANNTNVLTITYPTFTKAGLYHFTISEEVGSTQGVTYNTESTQIKLSVLVVYDYDNSCLKIDGQGITAVGEDKEKKDELKNTYEMGSLEISKSVTGNLGKKDQLFTIKVTLTTESGKYVYSDITVAGGSDAGNEQIVKGNGWTGSKEVTIKLMDSETVTISNIPAGVSYTIAEDTSHAAPDATNGSNGAVGYTVTYADTNDNDKADEDTDGAGKIAVGVKSSTTVTNDKSIEIDTGIALDSAPYVLLMALTVIGLAVLFVRKREEY